MEQVAQTMGFKLLFSDEGVYWIESPNGDHNSLDALMATMPGDEWWPKGLPTGVFEYLRDKAWEHDETEEVVRTTFEQQ